MFADSKLPRPYFCHKDRVAATTSERAPGAKEGRKQRSLLKMLASIFQTWSFDCEYAAEVGTSLSLTRSNHFETPEPAVKRSCPFTLRHPSSSCPSPSSSVSSSSSSLSNSSPSPSLSSSPSPSSSADASPSSTPSPSSSPTSLCGGAPMPPIMFRSDKRSCLKNAKRPLRCRGRRYPLYLIIEREGEPEEEEEEEKAVL